MSWRDRVKVPATFRKVPFFVETSERGGGRRGVTHEYPFRDESFREDLGLKVRTFPVEGYVVGTEYMDARDALLTALESVGPGELVHPYYGPLQAAVLSYRVRESKDEGGTARFSIEFEQTPVKPAQPTSVPDAPADVRASATAARTSAGVEFLAKYNPGTLLASVDGALRSATLSIRNAVARVRMGTESVARLKKRLDDFEGAISSVVNSGEDIVADLGEIFGLMDSRTALADVYGFDPGVRPPATTSNREQEQTNFDALWRLLQRLAAIRAVELAVDETFDSYETAVAARDSLTAQLDEQAEDASDDTYPDLMQLRSDLVKAIPGSGDLAHLVAYTPPVTLPSLVVAHRLYGNLDLELDLVARNGVDHPGFVLGGQPLEVLSRG